MPGAKYCILTSEVNFKTVTVGVKKITIHLKEMP